MARSSKPPRRRQPKQERAAVTAAAVVQAAIVILEEEGVERLTTNRIAEVAGVSVGSLYEYFPNKESVVANVIKRGQELDVAMLEHAIGLCKHVPLVEAVPFIVGGMLTTYRQHLRARRILWDLLPRVGAGPARVAALNDCVGLMARLIDDHRSEVGPGVDAVDAQVIVTALDALLRAPIIGEGEWPADEVLAERLTRLVLSYLGCR